jgi:hypothetical protein
MDDAAGDLGGGAGAFGSCALNRRPSPCFGSASRVAAQK